MRACLLVALVLLAIPLISARGAEVERYVVATAAIAESVGTSYGTTEADETGRERVDTSVDDRRVTVATGRAIVSAHGEDGQASVLAQDVDILDGRVTATRVRRTATTAETTSLVAGLQIDGDKLGATEETKTYKLGDSGRVIVNGDRAGLRVVTDHADVRVAVVQARTLTRRVEPTPTPTPKPTRTAKPSPTPTKKRKKPPEVPRRLSAGGYAFPVYGDVEYEDTFGAARAAPIVAHEGNDIFADFGSPVVAVRDGRLTHVGTLPISGNRLWVIDDSGDAFFYAHLSSFSTAARNGARVKAGDVLGFVGNTGDAEPTPPHLHFEVHPGGLKEDAVDPYPILRAWQENEDVPPGAWLQKLGAEAADRPGALVTVRDFIAE